MVDQDLTEVVSLLSRRSDFLRALREGEATKQELVEALCVSRSTVDRAVRELESQGLIVRERGSARLTLAGRLALDAYDELVSTLGGICTASNTLDLLPPDARIAPELFRGATIVSARHHDPHRAASELEEFAKTAEKIQGCAAAVFPTHVEMYHDRLVSNEFEVELVVTDAVLDTLLSDYRDLFEDSLASDNLSIYLASDSLSYSLLVGEIGDAAEVCLAAHGEHGVAGVVRNDDPAAVSWARDAFRAHRYAAEEIART